MVDKVEEVRGLKECFDNAQIRSDYYQQRAYEIVKLLNKEEYKRLSPLELPENWV